MIILTPSKEDRTIEKEAEKLTAIIVDDSDLIRTVIRAVLEKLGFNVIGEASDGREGVNMAITLAPDLILLDVMMPKLNGYLALEEMIGKMQDPFIVMLTSVDDYEVVQQSMLAGAQGYIQKGSEAENIAERLAQYAKDLKKIHSK